MIVGGATFSVCGRYRHKLWRNWAQGPRALWVMLNPSKAGASEDDATIRRVTGFTKAWSFAGFDVFNLVDLIETASTKLRTLSWQELKGKRPNEFTRSLVSNDTAVVVVAWGATVCGHHGLETRARDVLVAIVDGTIHVPMCLGTTKEGAPAHPLRLAKTTKLRPYFGDSGLVKHYEG